MNAIELFLKPEISNNEDLDDPQTIINHSRIIQNKPYLKKLYLEYYFWFLQNLPEGARNVIELGSGGGFIKEVIPNAVTSDVIKLPGVEMRFSALDMPFQKQSVDAFVMLNVLHHLKEAEKFFHESSRCLRAGGKILMIEPANTLWSRAIYKYLHHEPFFPSIGWNISRGGPMTGANNALPWIIFFRDIDLFSKKFPKLRIKNISFHTPFRYLLSGGLLYKQILPGWTYPYIEAIERVFSPFSHHFGMFMSIEVEKLKQA